MKMSIRHPRDFFAGLIFIAFGLLAFFIGGGYSMGTTVRMGPGYFPRLLGVLLVLIGLVVTGRALLIDGPRVDKIELRPLLLVLLGIVAFALVLQPFGLIAATVVLVAIAAFGGWEFNWRDVLISAAILSAVGVGVFVRGLQLPIGVWPW
jgi:Tripartite tricarboxylate transporter TctB family